MLVVAIVIAYGAAQIFHVSFALGAFFSGMVMRESRYSHRAAMESLPLRDAFAVIFFVGVGMMFDPKVLYEQPLHVLAVLAIIILGKGLVAFGLVLLFRYTLHTALTEDSAAGGYELSFGRCHYFYRFESVCFCNDRSGS